MNNNPKHLFECISVGLLPGEAIDFRQHPTLPWLHIDCAGNRYINEEAYFELQISDFANDSIRFRDSDGNWDYTPNRKRLVFDTWNQGQELYKKEKLVHLDHNPFNYRPDNIVLLSSTSPQWKNEEREFAINTIEYMLVKDDKKYPRADYWKQFLIPNNYISYYLRTKPFPKLITRLKPRKKNSEYRVNPEQIQKMIELYEQGYSKSRISRELGFAKSTIDNHLRKNLPKKN